MWTEAKRPNVPATRREINGCVLIVGIPKGPATLDRGILEQLRKKRDASRHSARRDFRAHELYGAKLGLGALQDVPSRSSAKAAPPASPRHSHPRNRAARAFPEQDPAK